MNKPQASVKNTKKETLKAEELTTDTPISEKDEVKAAERRTAKLYKKATQVLKPKK